MFVSVMALQSERAGKYGALLDKRDFPRGRALTLLQHVSVPYECTVAVLGQEEPDLSENPPTIH